MYKGSTIWLYHKHYITFYIVARGLIRYKLVDRIQCSYLALSDPNFFYNTFNVICLLDKFHLFETKYLYILVNVYT